MGKAKRNREIQLTQGKVAFVDEGDYEMLSQFKWRVYPSKNTFYAGRRSYWNQGKKHEERRTIYMHRAILFPRPGFEIDHIDGNGLNNQRSNLRIVTRRQNNQNLHIKKTSRFPGVSFEKRRNKWRAMIRISGNLRHLGYSNDEFEAATIYRVACAVLIGG